MLAHARRRPADLVPQIRRVLVDAPLPRGKGVPRAVGILSPLVGRGCVLAHPPWSTAWSIPRPRPQVRGIYLFRSLAGAVGFGCMVERTVAGGVTFSLFRLGFFGSRPLRF